LSGLAIHELLVQGEAINNVVGLDNFFVPSHHTELSRFVGVPSRYVFAALVHLAVIVVAGCPVQRIIVILAGCNRCFTLSARGLLPIFLITRVLRALRREVLITAAGNTESILIALFLLVRPVRVRFFGLLVVVSTVIITLLRILSVGRVEGHSVSAFEGCPFAARLRGIGLSRTHLPFVHTTVDLRRKVYHFLEGKRIFVGNHILLNFFLQAFVEEVAESLI
ncbi:hypothetical protein MPH_11565, partial [Macrophomina phaseolina MS6]